jgi:hypothetical protein
MPTKRRRGKQRRAVSVEAEARAWRRVFYSGFDYLNELQALGIETKEALDAEAADAWQRHGAAWLARPNATGPNADAWAVRKFGEPTCQ